LNAVSGIFIVLGTTLCATDRDKPLLLLLFRYNLLKAFRISETQDFGKPLLHSDHPNVTSRRLYESEKSITRKDMKKRSELREDGEKY